MNLAKTNYPTLYITLGESLETEDIVEAKTQLLHTSGLFSKEVFATFCVPNDKDTTSCRKLKRTIIGQDPVTGQYESRSKIRNAEAGANGFITDPTLYPHFR